ncbi:alpha/beta hydrolase [Micromonospora sp. WMMA1363]|uniref:alpha/beta fold hydrolase n=1 Tax=Micromonospora sp. WMMA1363 TaxID=3053985 RepID=UPI00259CB619|nr:alpha/beta hydrolase [Micromonospora sp. WMMA1363]MDM4721115.1 alpha/beta hydrolase [Micromonospora sp. WMMA1363]
MSMVRVNGISVHVQQLAPSEPTTEVAPARSAHGPAASPVIVMIHGLVFDTLASWYLTVAHSFADAGFRVVMYDLRGHGRSERPPEGYRLDDFVDDLEALLATLDITSPTHLLGNSFGGTIAMGYATRHPERVASITAVESALPTEAWWRRVTRRLSEAAELTSRLSDAAELTSRLSDAAELTSRLSDAAELTSRLSDAAELTSRLSDAADPLSHEVDFLKNTAGRGALVARQAETARRVLATTGLVRDIPVSRLPTDDQLTAISCPVLCVYGRGSAVVELAPQVQRLLPQARVVTVPGQHTLLIDQPHTVREIVLSWLQDDCDGCHPGRQRHVRQHDDAEPPRTSDVPPPAAVTLTADRPLEEPFDDLTAV